MMITEIYELTIRADGDHGLGIATLDGDTWSDPHGGTFSAIEQAALHAFARGARADLLILCGHEWFGPRLVARYVSRKEASP